MSKQFAGPTGSQEIMRSFSIMNKSIFSWNITIQVWPTKLCYTSLTVEFVGVLDPVITELVLLAAVVFVIVPSSTLLLDLYSVCAGHSAIKATDKTARGQIILFLANFILQLGNHCHSCGFSARKLLSLPSLNHNWRKIALLKTKNLGLFFHGQSWPTHKSWR